MLLQILSEFLYIPVMLRCIRFCLQFDRFDRPGSTNAYGRSYLVVEVLLTQNKSPLNRGTTAIPLLCLSHEKVTIYPLYPLKVAVCYQFKRILSPWTWSYHGYFAPSADIDTQLPPVAITNVKVQNIPLNANDVHPVILVRLFIFLTLLEILSRISGLEVASADFQQASPDLIEAMVLTDSVWRDTSLFPNQNLVVRELLMQIANNPKQLCSPLLHFAPSSFKRVASTAKRLLEFHLSWPKESSKLVELARQSLDNKFYKWRPCMFLGAPWKMLHNRSLYKKLIRWQL